MRVTLYWQARATIEKNYSVFVHLLDAQGYIVAQRDTYPGLGNYPTSTWVPGEVIRDAYPVHLPLGLLPDTYRVRVGLYFLPTLERLPVRAADRPVEGQAVEIAQVELCTP